MQYINVRETREKLAALLDSVTAGEEIVILRHGKPTAKLTAARPEKIRFPNRSKLRDELPPCDESAASAVRNLRDNERF